MQNGVVNGPGEAQNLGLGPRELMQLSAIHMYDPHNPTKYQSEGVIYEVLGTGGVIPDSKEMDKNIVTESYKTELGEFWNMKWRTSKK